MLENYLEIGGVRVRYLEEGAGPAVILLHDASLGSSADVWTRNLADLAAHGFRVIAPDLPGFGLTDNPRDHSLDARVKFVPAFLDALGIDRAHIVGHSHAGHIAVRLAVAQPQRVRKVVVVGTAHLLPPLPNSAAGDAAEGDEGDDSEPTIYETRRRLADSLFDQTRITPEAVALRHSMSTGKNFSAFLARRAAKSSDKKEAKPLWQRLDEVKVPMRLIYGQQDRSAERRAALARQRFPSLDVHLIDRCRHLVQWDAPTQMASLVAEFLAER
ncbi:MAG TPA: alpha/beta fold hydrolase [Usitatibacter sp.]|nr:alpha/beta fold hydrolase [Usitatibacter sp.]